MRTSRDSVIWFDGVKAYSWLPNTILRKGGFLLEKENDLNLLVDDTMKPSGGTVSIIPSLLMRDFAPYTFADVVTDMTDLALMGEDHVEGELCYVIRGKASSPPWLLWVGKKSPLLRKIRTSYSAGSYHEMLERGVTDGMIVEEIHHEIRINEKIPDRIFRYRPRVGANDDDLTR